MSAEDRSTRPEAPAGAPGAGAVLTIDSATTGYLQRLSDADRLWLREQAIERLSRPEMTAADGQMSTAREHIVDALVAAAGHDLYMIHDAEVLNALDAELGES